MNTLNFIKDFWLDFFSANHKRLMRKASYEAPISTLLHLSFIQAVNFNTIFVLILHFLLGVKLNFIVLFLPIIVFAFINSYLFYVRLSLRKRMKILDRKPRYKTIVYDIYDVSSTLLFILSMFIISKNR